MGYRDIPFDKNAICDECGRKGAYDLMGDYFCPKCLQEYLEDDLDELEEDYDGT